MSKTTNVENPEFTGYYFIPGKKLELDIPKKGAGKMPAKLQEEYTLQITDAVFHTCEYDEETKTAQRKYDGKTVDAADEILKQIRDYRKAKGRPIKEVSKVSGNLAKYTILDLDTGEVENGTADVER